MTFLTPPQKHRSRRVKTVAVDDVSEQEGQNRVHLFLQRSRETAARRHERRVSELESQYVRRLQQRGGAAGIHDYEDAGNDIVEVIEIEVDEGDDSDSNTVNDNEKNKNWVNRKEEGEEEKWMSCVFTSSDVHEQNNKKTPLLHSSPALLTPQSQANSCGISPEMFTPATFAPAEETPHSCPVVVPAVVRTAVKHVSMDGTGAIADIKRKKTPTVVATSPSPFKRESPDEVHTKLFLDPCTEEKKKKKKEEMEYSAESHVKAPLNMVKEYDDDDYDVTRCLMTAFGNHLDAESPMHAPPPTTTTKTKTSAAGPFEAELEEFLKWQAEKPHKRRECLQKGLNCGSYLAKVYAVGQPELHYSGLFNAASAQETKPLTPECPASRYIEWISSHVDLYEDLLMHRTPVSKDPELVVGNGVCDVVLDKYIMDFVVDCILQK